MTNKLQNPTQRKKFTKIPFLITLMIRKGNSKLKRRRRRSLNPNVILPLPPPLHILMKKK